MNQIEQEQNLNTYLNNIPYEYKYLSLTQAAGPQRPQGLRPAQRVLLVQDQRLK
jgi:hypothetical protein